MANFFEAGSWIWIPDSTEVVLPAKVVNTFYKGEPGKVLVDGKPRSLAPAESAECTLADQQTLNPDVDNLTSLDDLNENSLLNILRERYNLNRIYSNIGSILVSVNPFKALPLYTPQQIDMYKEGPRGKPPHVFAVGHNAYYEMINERKNQSIIITGESGAGKSEACKLVLQFIADLSANHSGKSVADDDTGIEQQLLQANPILEAFGNAKTVRNNNSSRFGKLITVKFDRLGAICESTVVSYLLEKSRVVHQSANERNYHIFYELVAAAEEDPSLCAQLRLDSCEAFAYLSQSGVTRIEGVVDENDFDEVCNAMDILNFEESSQMEIWKIVAAILHFGNVKFTATAAFDKDETARIINTDTLNFAAGLIGINAQTFSRVLTQRILSVGKVVVPYKVREAMDTRDAMVKTLYALMFEWIIRKINMTLEKNAGSTSARNSRDSIIGLLDIFGFESFTTNSFEQLCINYCNEKLNNHFNEHVFKHELAIYVQEGVSVRDLSYKDNMPILEFLENGHNGIYSMMDEQIMVNGTDDKFLSRVQQIHSKSPQYVMPTRKNCTDPEARNCFGVLHYAGEVFYNVRGFLDKNRDALHPDVIEAMQSSKSQIVSEIFQEDSKLGRGKYSSMRDVLTAGATSPGGPSQSRKGKMATGNTLGKQFRAQLDALMVTLNATDPHYIRCMKPNNEKRGSMFKSQMMLQQLRYSGLLEVCRIRKMGYPIRRTYDEFFARYQVIHPSCATTEALLAKLTAAGTVDDTRLLKGNTKILMKQVQANDLDVAREVALQRHVIRIQGVARGFLTRRRLFYFKRIMAELRAAMKARDENKLVYWLSQADELPNNGQHFPVVQEATTVLRRLEQESKVVGLIMDALLNSDLNALLSAIDDAKRMQPPLQHPKLEEAERMKDILEEERQLRLELRDCIEKRDIKAIDELLARAQVLGIVNEETKNAKALKARIEEEGNTKLKVATLGSDSEAIAAVITRCMAAGMATKYAVDINAAKEKQRQIANQSKAKHALELALRTRSLDRIEESLVKADACGLTGREVEDARIMRAELARKRQVFQEIQAAMQAKDMDALGAALREAEILDMEAELLEYTELQEMKNSMNREEKIAEVKAKLSAGVGAEDLQALNKAMAMAIELGCEGDVDVQQLEAQAMLTQALASLSKAKMRDALEFAEELELELEMMIRVRRALRRIEVMRDDDAPLDGGLHTMSESDIEQFRAERDKRHAKAGNPKYKFQNYPRLRSRSDYARGTLLYKRREQEKMLCWQNTVANKSLTDLDKDLVKEAIAVRKSLLGYMGDKQMAFPETLAQNILFKGLDKPKLRDEAYLQIMKQLTDNPKPESAAKGWQVLCMCCGTFLPSMDFENYLLNFVLDKSQSEGAEACYARYCLHTLEGMMSSRTNEGIVPTLEEIQAYKERPPILATIELVNGALLTEDLPIAPDLNVKKVLEICAHFGGLQAARTDIMGMFVYDLGPIDEEAGEPGGMLPFTPTPLRNEDYMGDQFIRKARQRRDFKFVYKRKIALHSHPWPSQDAAYNRLVYLQAEDDVIRSGTLEIDDQSSVVLMSAIAMAMDLALEGDAPTDPAVLRENVTNYIPPNWKDKVDLAIWTEELVKLWPDLISKDRHELEIMFVEQCRDRPMYGSHFFYATKVQCVPDLMSNLPKQLLLAFNADGMQIFNINRKDMLQQYTYADVHSWRGTRRQVSLTIWDQDTDSVFELALKTQQAQDMAAIILDHINAIMNNNGKN
ncbi:myosin I, high molecular weight-Acanthamoeba sp [Tribonema minus]|uniref:Myosin I, high molecular weight-Acanthamoeba sp n=1 Tax=Tribonema minus TaxID=303371 RepID=A0A835YPP0_9STRA|nr:myosin I, high molecular weight-Acanthamoeba sp [Tribonema minus]